MIAMNTDQVVKRKVNICLLALLVAGIVLGCTGKGRRNDLCPLSDGTFDDEYQQHIVITDDSVKPFEVVSKDACLHVELPQKMQPTRLDTVFSSYSFVRLETTDGCLVGHIDRIIKCPGCYCILDRDNANVFIFEEDGKFRCKLGCKGHARNEHLDAWSIAYDAKNNHIVLLDLTGRRLQSYDLNGNLKKVAPLFFLYTDMAFLGDDILCLTGTSYNAFSDIIDLSRLVLADRKQMPLRVGFPTTERARYEFCRGEWMAQYEGKAYFTDMVSDTLWEVSGSRMAPVLVMEVNGKPRFTQSEKEAMTDKLYNERNMSFPCGFMFYATPGYFFAHVGLPKEGGMVANVVVSRKSGRSKVLGIHNGQDRLGDYLFANGADGMWDDKTLLSVLSPTMVLAAFEGSKVMESMTDDERRTFQNLQPDDNPVLMLSRLVDF